jgi:hypothetical protein
MKRDAPAEVSAGDHLAAAAILAEYFQCLSKGKRPNDLRMGASDVWDLAK